ncbi:phage replisome organizer N-terminal domain-containing protein [Lederbergia sp. NSJ-179]|uniref:phage replisome organizer N-terminal domain-containing protein n=1 Tax=Lederbergia sp. NSJ-179 TaxID=2931402 RepID=UPI001FD0F49B|nr:phage replisome organizer N-terminal domain-containing protein [Lederbergia sp. NSJ-179]MCJ7840535.1 phage replisome organizer N-terminal domain-containing protein [Lederbergia sp. NSJ-179]
MLSVKWIKLSTQMFEDEKIRLIESMPEADTILIIWVKLLAQAGRTNASGYIFLSENIPYTDEMLATLFHRPVTTVRLALETFKQFGMIEIDDQSFIRISNWDKHQSLEGLEKIREQNRQRVAKHREKKRLESGNATGNVTCNKNVTDIDKELDIDNIYVEIINYLNRAAGKNFRHTTPATRKVIKARWNEGFRVEDFKTVIDNKIADWLNNNDMSQYLRPNTLFGTKFESYLNQKPEKKDPPDPGSPAPFNYDINAGEDWHED